MLSEKKSSTFLPSLKIKAFSFFPGGCLRKLLHGPRYNFPLYKLIFNRPDDQGNWGDIGDQPDQPEPNNNNGLETYQCPMPARIVNFGREGRCRISSDTRIVIVVVAAVSICYHRSGSRGQTLWRNIRTPPYGAATTMAAVRFAQLHAIERQAMLHL